MTSASLTSGNSRPGSENLSEAVAAFDESKAATASDKFSEPGRELPLVSDADVIVCGAGPAGVAAAITAARGGARVRLFEWRGCVGGVWTAGLLGYLLDFNKPGFAQELAGKLEERGVRRG